MCEKWEACDANWDEFNAANEILKHVEDKTLKKNENSYEYSGLGIPFQFFIPLLTALGRQLNDGIVIDKNAFIDNETLKTSIGKNDDRNKDITDNRKFRAIAFLTWEKEHRLFVVRRVWPATLHFLGHSYIPDGWGITGKLVDKISQETNETNWMINIFNEVSVDNPKQGILPFVRDIKDLDYKAVSVLPVFEDYNEQKLDSLLGSYIFFYNDHIHQIPSDDWQKKLSQATAKALIPHFDRITGNDTISSAWKSIVGNEFVDEPVNLGDIVIAVLTLKKGNKKSQNLMMGYIIEELSRPEFYVVIDTDYDHDVDNVILIAPRDVDKNGKCNIEHIKSIIYTAVAEARGLCKDEEGKNIISKLQWLAKEQTTTKNDNP